MTDTSERKRPILGFFGIGAGAIALMLAIVHFWAGPFSPQPTLEQSVAETAVAIRDATMAALRGEEIATQQESGWDLDKLAMTSTGVLGGLAIILAVVGFAFGEPMRVGAGGVILGSAALAFQFAIVALGALIFCVLVAAVLGELGIG